MDRNHSSATPPRHLPRWLIPALGYIVAIVCLVWVYRGFNWEDELLRLAAADWRFVSAAMIADLAVYICQGWRWSVLLKPLAKVSTFKSIQAIYIGLFANEVLPFRSGEVIRCYLQKRWTGLRLPVVVTSALIERLFDGIWLMVLFYIAGIFVALPKLLIGGAQVLSAMLIIVSVLVAAAIFYKGRANDMASHSRWSRLLYQIVDSVNKMGRSSSFVGAFLLSGVYLLLQILPIYFLIQAYDLPVPPVAALTVLVVLRLGTVIPQAPANVGAFQFFTILALSLFGLSRVEAAGFATLLFVVVAFPLWLGGFVALLATRMRIADIHKVAEEQFEKEPIN